MSVSVADAVNRAVERTKGMLFPFVLNRWLSIGFIAFLAGLGGGGSSYGSRLPFPGSSSSGSGGLGGSGGTSSAWFDEAMTWLRANMTLAVSLSAGVLLLALGLGLVITWLSSRGKLMFVESVIHNRDAVREPWERLREPSWDLFKFRLLLGVLWLLALMVSLGIGLVIALPDIHAKSFGTVAGLGILAALSLSALTLLPLTIILALLDDFVVPISYVRGLRIGAAFRTFRAEVLPGNVGNLLVFYVLKVALSLGFALVAMMATCLTCCLAALPYVGTVVLLPGYVFFRAYGLYFLQQLGVVVFQEPPAFGFEPYRFSGED